MKDVIKKCMCIAFLLCFFTLRTAAEDASLVTDELRENYASFLESIPGEVADLLPERNLYSSLQNSLDASLDMDMLEMECMVRKSK